MKNIKNKVRNVANKGVGTIQKVEKVKIIDEFKTFIARGNVLDLAVGVIIGAAFQNLVTSLTTNIISPILGCFTEVDFTYYSLKIGNLNIKYGAFLTDIINFIIMAFIVFLIVKFMNKLIIRKDDEPKEIEKKEDPQEKLLREIRDLLKEKVEK